MIKKYCKWKDEERKKLFDFVETCGEKGLSLTQVFKLYAEQNKRKPNSVRNYYYAELLNLENSKQDRQKLQIDLSKHKKNIPQFFSEQETNKTMEAITDLTKRGYSVRKACLTLANGDISKMVRLQNKYRTTIQKNTSQFNEPMPQNIISMPVKKTKLSEAEINSLFLGLVKLIKTSAKQELNLKIQKDAEDANFTLRQTLVNLSNKEHQLESLKKSFELLKIEKEKLDEKIKILRAKNPKTENEKLNALKAYTSNIKKSQIKNKKTNN